MVEIWICKLDIIFSRSYGKLNQIDFPETLKTSKVMKYYNSTVHKDSTWISINHISGNLIIVARQELKKIKRIISIYICAGE